MLSRRLNVGKSQMVLLECLPYHNRRQFPDNHPTRKLVTSAPRAYLWPIGLGTALLMQRSS